ncbi:CatA-like O-acetyltransferase [Flavobacterium sp. JP2137]|uniref:CatA-like O-acetyltransferase n=1 Tax=Flavobacterium sp. JP2137 TaxID=3414510 RepID=UPI003D2FA886
MTAVFTPVDLKTWPRTPYFNYYFYELKSKYNLNVTLDITELLQQSKAKNYRFYPTFIYVILRAINQNSAFRMSFHQGELGHWNFIMPSFTIFHPDDCSFSDLWSEYHRDFKTYYDVITRDIETYKNVKGIKIRANQPPNFCPISCLPWVSFTGISQDSAVDDHFLFPIVRFGKYFEQGDRILLPLSLYAHHAVADGYHSSKLINDIQDFCTQVDQWMT